LLIFIAYWVLSLPIGYLLGFAFGMGVAGIWIALLAGLTLTAIFLLWRFYNFAHRFKQ
ncbi:MAG: MATE family efflux transporter, partial [Candidatus Nephrothrix sp. EaCA]